MLPPLNALKCFETVARSGSFKAAAEDLCVTQSAVSHQIRKVEEWLGAPLFAREARGVRLLPRAEALAQRLSLAFSEIETACADALGHVAKPLTVAAIPSVAMCWLIPRLPEFRAMHPDIDLQIVYARHGERPNFKTVDVAMTFDRCAPDLPLVTSQLFLSGDCVPVCRRDLLAPQHPDVATAEELHALGLLHDTDRSGWSEWLECPGPLPGPVFEDFNMLRSAVLSGQGVALCPLAMIGPDIAAGHFVALAKTPRSMGSDYYLSTRKDGARSVQDQIDRFANWVMANASAEHSGMSGAVTPGIVRYGQSA